ncbi:1793_t:CDS:2 [Ambispora gerdemannii]|uniref:Chitinase domain-containing protein 1 n=1 Tax=Ambispora gerdemannii TaxID=144530 RepID=A0A9N8V6M2_9GLOM|nr:1793_t:CDS:2 [Ambispora gerdemannii]
MYSNLNKHYLFIIHLLVFLLLCISHNNNIFLILKKQINCGGSCVLADEEQKSIYEKDLVSTSITYQEIIDHHDRFLKPNASAIKYFDGGPTLAYVTPWNSHGYDIVKMVKGKFEYVSPVWYNIIRRPHLRNKYDLTGAHDVDQTWISEIRSNNKKQKYGKIVPRFRTQSWTETDYLSLLSSHDEMQQFAKVLADECHTQNFDGLVLEMGIASIFLLRDLVQELGELLHQQGKELILVVSPIRTGVPPSLTAAQFDDFSFFVDRFSVMVYDYSTSLGNSQGPNADINWVEDNILHFTPTSRNRDKLLLGLNMYGTDYLDSKRSDPIIGKDIIKILEKHKPKKITWDKVSAEHHFEYVKTGVKHDVWFPTLKSLEQRILLAEDYGTGLSLWEVGQGLDYFYELF